MQVLAIDVGGTHVKILTTGRTEKRAMECDNANAFLGGFRLWEKSWRQLTK
jgi:hexokinase